MALNSKHVIFVKEYLVDQNASRAYRVMKPTCTAKTARVEGSKLLAKPDIAAAIKKGMDARIADAEKRAAAVGITKDRWLEELSRIAFANIDDFITIGPRPIFNGRKGKAYQVLTAVPVTTKDRAPGLGHAIKSIKETKNGIGIELHSKQAALELIGKSYGWVKSDFELPPTNVHVVLTMPANGREAKKDDTK